MIIKKILHDISVILLSLVLLLFIILVDSFARKGVAGQAGSFLSWGAGARSLAMGKAYVALSEDASASYWNPAGLANISRQEGMFLHAMLWAGTMYDFLSYVRPVTNWGTLGIGMVRLYSGGFEKRNQWNELVGSFGDEQTAYSLSLGRRVADYLSLGVNAKMLRHTLDWHTNSSFVVDLGAMYRPAAVSNLQVGLNLQNMLELELSPSEDELPMTMRLGAAYKLLKDRLSTSLDLVKNFQMPGVEYHLGGEYWPLLYTALRLGIDINEITLGFGFNWKDYGLDYAFAMHELGGSHRLSASVKFGPSIEAARQKTARESFLKAMAALEKGYFDKAQELSNMAQTYDPQNKDYIFMVDRLDVVSKVVAKASKDDKEDDLLRRAVLKYTEQRPQHALEILRYLLSLDPSNTRVQRLIKAIKDKEGMTQPEPEMAKGMTLVDQKLYQALNYFYEGRYDMAIKESQDVLLLEPNNSLAYKRIGSAFYALGDTEKSVQNWKKSLELDPSDEQLRSFIDNIAREKNKGAEEGLEFLKELGR